jgi:hypothetical protein
MKKLLLSILVFGALASRSQTATNFNVNDCGGTSHDLFTELNSGKVIVLCWVMPCGACISPAQSAHNIVQSYASSNPGVVQFYLCDDYGTTSCTTLNNWKTSNGLTQATVFSNAAIKMSDYGSTGMPKMVVLGGLNHQVYDNQNNTLNSTTFSTAINNALAAATSITEVSADVVSAKVSPNPASSELTLSYNAKQTDKLFIEIYNSIGQKVKVVENASAFGKNEIKVNVESLSTGNYFVRVDNGKSVETVKFSIAR